MPMKQASQTSSDVEDCIGKGAGNNYHAETKSAEGQDGDDWQKQDQTKGQDQTDDQVHQDDHQDNDPKRLGAADGNPANLGKQPEKAAGDQEVHNKIEQGIARAKHSNLRFSGA